MLEERTFGICTDTVKRYDGNRLFDKEFMRYIDKQQEPVVFSNCQAWYGAEAQWALDVSSVQSLPHISLSSIVPLLEAVTVLSERVLQSGRNTRW